MVPKLLADSGGEKGPGDLGPDRKEDGARLSAEKRCGRLTDRFLGSLGIPCCERGRACFPFEKVDTEDT